MFRGKGRSKILLAWGIRVCIIVFVLLVALLHILDQVHEPTRQALSEYSIGPQGKLMILAFLAFSLGTLGLAVGLFRCMGRSRGSRTAFLLLMSVCMLVALAGIFPVDPQGSNYSVSGIIHDIASLAGLTLAILAMAYWTRQMETVDAFKRYAQASGRLTLVSAALYVVFLISSPSFQGLTQRVFISSILAWEWYGSQLLIEGV